MGLGLEIYSPTGHVVFSSEEDKPFTLIGSVEGSGTLPLKGSGFTYFHMVINTQRLRDNLKDDFTPQFSVTYDTTYSQVTITAPTGTKTLIGYY